MTLPENLPAAFTIDATARYLSISKTGIYRLITRGVLTPVKIGHRTLIRRVDADRLLEGGGAGLPVASSNVTRRRAAPARHAEIFG